MSRKKNADKFLLCINNEDYPASLEVRKLYRVVPDPTAEALKFVRVVDESGEAYLYPADYFVPIELPQAARVAFVEAT